MSGNGKTKTAQVQGRSHIVTLITRRRAHRGPLTFLTANGGWTKQPGLAEQFTDEAGANKRLGRRSGFLKPYYRDSNGLIMYPV